jgi:hypothetical protein
MAGPLMIMRTKLFLFGWGINSFDLADFGIFCSQLQQRYPNQNAHQRSKQLHHKILYKADLQDSEIFRRVELVQFLFFQKAFA